MDEVINLKCNTCVHEQVCVYKNKLEEVRSIFIPIKNKCDEYSVFECDIRCTQYRKDEPVEEVQYDDFYWYENYRIKGGSPGD